MAFRVDAPAFVPKNRSSASVVATNDDGDRWRRRARPRRRRATNDGVRGETATASDGGDEDER